MQIAISWNELPIYGARCIRAGVERSRHSVVVVATRPTIPLKGMDDVLPGVRWIDDRHAPTSWQQLGLDVPDIFFQAGWYIPSFIGLGAQVRAKGKPVVLLADNAWKNTPRQWAGAIKYRLAYRRQFAGVWVPGAMGVKLMRFLGVRRDRIFDGLYGTDPRLFDVGANLRARSKSFIFVGRLTGLKGIPVLAEAFQRFHQQYPDWKLVVFGDGESRALLEGKPGVDFRAFAQPDEVSAGLRATRFLVLPTLTDNWPLVVSEAALSGCGLLLSDRVGNCTEFLGKSNGCVFKAKSADALMKAMIWAANVPDTQLANAGSESRELGLRFTPAQWAVRFEEIILQISSQIG